MTALVLASASSARAQLLQAAGVTAIADAADLDESSVKTAMAAEGRSAEQAALSLAVLKAQAVSLRHPGAMVIGGDQILECEGRWLDKPETMSEARRHLVALRGRRHALATTVAAVRDGALLWQHAESAHLTMRRFSDDFLEAYLVAAGPGVCQTVGGYRLEEQGVQLFEAIDGDHFSILGLPLLPLLSYLRKQRMVQQ
jgi:septum formation protein